MLRSTVPCNGSATEDNQAETSLEVTWLISGLASTRWTDTVGPARLNCLKVFSISGCTHTARAHTHTHAAVSKFDCASTYKHKGGVWEETWFSWCRIHAPAIIVPLPGPSSITCTCGGLPAKQSNPNRIIIIIVCLFISWRLKTTQSGKTMFQHPCRFGRPLSLSTESCNALKKSTAYRCTQTWAMNIGSPRARDTEETIGHKTQNTGHMRHATGHCTCRHPLRDVPNADELIQQLNMGAAKARNAANVAGHQKNKDANKETQPPSQHLDLVPVQRHAGC